LNGATRTLDEAEALLDREQRLLLADGAVDDGDDDLVVQLGGAADDVEVAVRDGVIRARADGYGLAEGHP
jgi:hypothetical protein